MIAQLFTIKHFQVRDVVLVLLGRSEKGTHKVTRSEVVRGVSVLYNHQVEEAIKGHGVEGRTRVPSNDVSSKRARIIAAVNRSRSQPDIAERESLRPVERKASAKN